MKIALGNLYPKLIPFLSFSSNLYAIFVLEGRSVFELLNSILHCIDILGFNNSCRLLMSTQITEPILLNRTDYLNLSVEQTPILELISDLLNDKSSLKKGVNHDPLTTIAGVNTLLGAMTTTGSLETMGQIYNAIIEVIFQQLQRLAEKRGHSPAFLDELIMLCGEIQKLHPFAHRTTVQSMLNDHTKENSDQWLNQSFQQCIKELDVMGYKPPQIVINQDPHFADFKPSFKNNEIRQILIGGRTTLKTGYQFNLANISPIGLYFAMELVPKRQADGKDLGHLHYAIVFGKATDRAHEAGLPLVNLQGDRGLEAAGLFIISQQHAWPSASGEVGALAEITKTVFLTTPWSSTHQTKAELFAEANFAELMVKTSNLPRNQYTGNQPLVQAVVGDTQKCKIPVETAILVLRKHDGKYEEFLPIDVHNQVVKFTHDLKMNEMLIESLKNDYFRMLRVVNPDYLDKGLMMKLNAKSSEQLTGEVLDAWTIRKQYNKAKRVGAGIKDNLNVFLRDFLVYEIGVDKDALNLLKGLPCKARTQLVSALKSHGKEYDSRWCIESGFEIIEYQFPIQYQGYSSDTHFRVYVLQAMMFNSYRVAQIKHIGENKPPNWRPWDPKMNLRCRQFNPTDQRSFSTKGYLLGLLKESLNDYFCRALS
jgi:hypothetical protein